MITTHISVLTRRTSVSKQGEALKAGMGEHLLSPLGQRSLNPCRIGRVSDYVQLIARHGGACRCKDAQTEQNGHADLRPAFQGQSEKQVRWIQSQSQVRCCSPGFDRQSVSLCLIPITWSRVRLTCCKEAIVAVHFRQVAGSWHLHIPELPRW